MEGVWGMWFLAHRRLLSGSEVLQIGASSVYQHSDSSRNAIQLSISFSTAVEMAFNCQFRFRLESKTISTLDFHFVLSRNEF